MRDRYSIQFDNVQYCRLLAANMKYVGLFATGREIEYGEDDYRREIVLKAYCDMPLYPKRPLAHLPAHQRPRTKRTRPRQPKLYRSR